MKHKLVVLLAAALVLAAASTSFADVVYPYSNPTYIPNIRPAAFTVASGVAGSTVTLNNIGTVTVQLTGTCTSLVGVLEASNNATTWSSLIVYPNGASSVSNGAATMTATGMYSANTGGHNLVRMNNTGVSGTACAGTMAGSPTTFSLPH